MRIIAGEQSIWVSCIPFFLLLLALTLSKDQAIIFTGSYLKCFDHLGGGATDLKKRDLLGGDVGFHRRSLENRDSVEDRFSGFCDSANFNKAQWDKASLGSQLELR